MRVAEGTGSVDPVRQAVADRLGLRVDDSNVSEFSQWVGKRMRDVGCANQTDYSDLVLGDSDELRVLAERFTVGESYFFREGAQLDALVRDVLPPLQSRADSEVVRILCAGCSNGQEAYTLVMRIREDFPALPLFVTAVDLNRESIATAEAASFGEWSLRGVSDERRKRWFIESSSGFEPVQAVRELVSFEQRNLVDADPGFWRRGRFDIIFCRNVLIYFTREAAKSVVTRMAYSLRPGGHLFLGHSEHLRGLSEDFTLCNTSRAFYYARRMPDLAVGAGSEPVPESATGSRPRPRGAPRRPRQPRPPAATRTLDGRQNREPDSTSDTASEPNEPSLDNSLLAPVLAAFRAEQYGKASEELARLPLEVRNGSGAQLLEATILTCSKDRAAESALKSLLARDDLNPDAHYLMGLWEESMGHLDVARTHQRAAIYLDPTFGFAHMQCARLAVRTGDNSAALRAFRAAADLLVHEKDIRILLFGAGFARETHVRICCQELLALGGSR